MPVPNFFVVGAPKAGTTALYHYLDQHPAIYMSPIKEPAFFAADLFEYKRLLGLVEPDPDGLRDYLDGPMTERRSGVISEWEQYLKLFKNVSQETAIGEVSGNYLASSSAPRAIRERIPHARVIMMLRDPVDRLYSQYSEAAGRGQAELDFLPWVEQQQVVEAASRPRLGAVWNGFYAQHLKRYLGHFPSPQVRAFLYQDYRRSVHSVLRDLFVFLSVDPDFKVDVTRHHNVTLQRRSIPFRNVLRSVLPRIIVHRLRAVTYKRPRQITPLERAAVLRIYEDDIRELQRLLARDLSDWLR